MRKNALDCRVSRTFVETRGSHPSVSAARTHLLLRPNANWVIYSGRQGGVCVCGCVGSTLRVIKIFFFRWFVFSRLTLHALLPVRTSTITRVINFPITKMSDLWMSTLRDENPHKYNNAVVLLLFISQRKKKKN